jgi:2-polyprenyl-6-methoxyphenol hydroxylase-like FAD-dependent oxidoreductase
MEARVIGGGPVGLFAAACLHERGVEVGVVDAQWERPVRSYACGLHPETLRLFDRLGMMPALRELAHRVDRLLVYRGPERVAAADLGRVGGAYPHVLTLRQSDLQDLLAQELARQGIEVALRQEVTSVHASTESVCTVSIPKRASGRSASESGDAGFAADPVVRRSDYLIAADGYDSRCRQSLGIELVDLDASEAFLIFEFEADLAELQHEAHLVVSPDSVSAFWPLGRSLGRWTFQISEHLGDTPDLHLLQLLLRQRAPWFRPRPEQLGWTTTAFFERRIASRFGSGRIWLAGDAAHVTSPIGFQNMNRGFVEASELASAISYSLQGERAAHDSFERFERAQHAEWRRLFGAGANVFSYGALSGEEGARLLPCLPASGADLDALLRQLALRVAAG